MWRCRLPLHSPWLPWLPCVSALAATTVSMIQREVSFSSGWRKTVCVRRLKIWSRGLRRFPGRIDLYINRVDVSYFPVYSAFLFTQENATSVNADEQQSEYLSRRTTLKPRLPDPRDSLRPRLDIFIYRRFPIIHTSFTVDKASHTHTHTHSYVTAAKNKKKKTKKTKQQKKPICVASPAKQLIMTTVAFLSAPCLSVHVYLLSSPVS